MNITRFALATLVAFVLSNILNTAYYAATAEGHNWAMTKAEPNYMLLMLNHLVFVVLLAYLYPIGYKGGAPWAEGARFGALMGLVMFVPTGLVVRLLGRCQSHPILLRILYFTRLPQPLWVLQSGWYTGIFDKCKQVNEHTLGSSIRLR